MRRSLSLGPSALVAGDDPPFVLVAVLLGAAVASRFLALAASPGEIDEAIFSGAVTNFDMARLSPQAPGFPVWILIGRLVKLVVPSPFHALAVAATLLAAVALPALYVWGRSLVGGWAALSGTLFAAALPVVWVIGGRPFSDSPATAFFLVSLATLSFLGGPAPPARGASVGLGVAAGLAAAAGCGVRPHLVMAFGPLLVVVFVRLVRRRDLRPAAIAFLVAAALGCTAWMTWLVSKAGGPAGLIAALHERASFRTYALATGTVGTFAESFLVRDFLSPRRAAACLAVALAGAVFLALRRNWRGLADVFLVLVPTFLSLWFLHNRAMGRYSVPFVLVVSLLFGAGLRGLLRWPALGLAAALGGALLFGRETWAEVRWSHTQTTPVMVAIERIERVVHPGRDTIVADSVFNAFVRMERWEGRLAAWAYSDSDLLGRLRPINRRVVRLADFTGLAKSPDDGDGEWETTFHGGRVAESLSTGRLLAVSFRDPGPPIYSEGFGLREHSGEGFDFRWAGAEALLVVPSIDELAAPLPLVAGRMLATGFGCPPVAILKGIRHGSDPTTIRVIRADTGVEVLRRTIQPGPFDLVIVPAPAQGRPAPPIQYLISCDRPEPVPPLPPGEIRPVRGCFVFGEWGETVRTDAAWRIVAGRLRLDVGSRWDLATDPEGFWPPEEVAKKTTQRWATGDASLWIFPSAGFVPRRLVLHARPPEKDPVDVAVTLDGIPAGSIRVEPGDFAEYGVDLKPEAVARLSGAAPVRLGLKSATWSPKRAGKGGDDRELGVAFDTLFLDPAPPTTRQLPDERR